MGLLSFLLKALKWIKYKFGLTERYENIRILDGDIGKVCECVDLFTGNKVVVKYDCSEKETEMLKFIKGKHSSFLEFIDVEEHKGEYRLITELVPGKDLFDFMVSMSGKKIDIKYIFYKSVEVVSAAHNLGIVHRDIKAENIMIWFNENGELQVKLIDWEFSVHKDNHSGNASGTINYAAPEILRINPDIGPYNDVWNLGVLLYIMLVRRFPFGGDTAEDKYNLIKNFEVDFSSKKLSFEDIIFLRKFFVESDKRITCKEILEDYWFKF